MTRWYIPRVRRRRAGPADRHVRADRALVRLCLSRSRRCRLGLVVQGLVLGLGRAGASRTHIAGGGSPVSGSRSAATRRAEASITAGCSDLDAR